MVIVGEAGIALRPDLSIFGREASTQFGPAGATAATGFTEGMKPSLFSRMKSIALTAGGIFLAGFAAQKIGAFVSDSISEASDINESTTKIQRVFGDAANSVLDFSQTSATALGQSRSQALEAAGTFGNLFRAIGLGQKESAGMSTQLLQTASDLASFNNASPEEALDALRSGLVGETEPLRQFGINMNDQTLKAEALKEGLINAGQATQTLKPDVKAQAAYGLILKQSSLAAGDFARTSSGLANQQRIFSAQIADSKAQLGQALLPALVSVMGFVTSVVLPGFQALLSIVGPAIAKVSQAFVGLSDVLLKGDFSSTFAQAFNVTEDAPIVGTLFRIRDAVIGLFAIFTKGDFTGALANAFNIGEDSPLVGQLLNIRNQAINIFRALAGAIGQIAGRIGPQIVPFLAAVGRAFLTVAKNSLAVWRAIGPVLLPVAKALAVALGAILVSILPVATALLNFASSGGAAGTAFRIIAGAILAGIVAWKAYQTAVAATAAIQAAYAAKKAALIALENSEVVLRARLAVMWVAEKARIVASTAAMVAQRVAVTTLAIAQRVAAVATTAFSVAMRLLNAAFITSPVGLIVVAIVALVAVLVLAWKRSETFRNIVIGTWNAIKTAAVTVFNFLKNVIVSTFNAYKTVIMTVLRFLIGFIRGAFNAYRTVITTVLKVIWKAITTYVKLWVLVFRTVLRVVITVVRTVFNGVKAVITTVLRVVSAVIRRELAVVKAVWNAVWKAVSAVIKRAWAIIQGIVRIGVAFVQREIRGFQVIIGYVRSVFESVVSSIREKIDAAIAIVKGIKARIVGFFSGAKDWLLQAGKNIIQGLIDGIGSMFGEVKGKFDELTSHLPGWKGPPSRDATLLRGSGQIIMDGLIDGFNDRTGAVESTLGSLTDRIGSAIGGRTRTAAVAAGAVPGAAAGGGGTTIYENNKLFGVSELTAAHRISERTAYRLRTGSRGPAQRIKVSTQREAS